MIYSAMFIFMFALFAVLTEHSTVVFHQCLRLLAGSYVLKCPILTQPVVWFSPSLDL